MFEEELTTLGMKLPVTASADREPEYELMCDSFVWSDELADVSDLSQGELGALRALWRYRTSLITGVRDGRFKELWTRCRAAVPNWVGFAEHRCRYSRKLADRYKELKCKAQSKGPDQR